MLFDRRRSGVLLHPTSLPGAYGIGDLGPAASNFLDYLARARQTLWQVLPLGPTGFSDSPYASPSAFAGNPNLIAPEPLLKQGVIDRDDLEALIELPVDRGDFGNLVPLKGEVLKKAFHKQKSAMKDRVQAFRLAQAAWLDDYAVFAALTAVHGLWTTWEAPLRRHERQAVERARRELREEVEFHTFCQFLFFEQWRAL